MSPHHVFFWGHPKVDTSDVAASFLRDMCFWRGEHEVEVKSISFSFVSCPLHKGNFRRKIRPRWWRLNQIVCWYPHRSTDPDADNRSRICWLTIVAFIGLVKPRICLRLPTSSQASTYTGHLFSLGFGDTVGPMPTLMDPCPSKVQCICNDISAGGWMEWCFSFWFDVRKVEIWGQIWMVLEEKSVRVMAPWCGHHTRNDRVRNASVISMWCLEGYGVETGRDMAVKMTREWRSCDRIMIYHCLKTLWSNGGINPHFHPEMVQMIHGNIEARNIGWWHETDQRNSHKHMC